MNPHPAITHSGGRPTFAAVVENATDSLNTIALGPEGVEDLEEQIGHHHAAILRETAHRDALQIQVYSLLARMPVRDPERVLKALEQVERVNARIERIEASIAEHLAEVVRISTERDRRQLTAYGVVSDLRKTAQSHKAALEGQRTPMCGAYHLYERSSGELKAEAEREMAERTPVPA